MKSPIFLFSIPRSGSTLLQKVLMSHNQIASVAEPWLLLPFLSVVTNSTALTEYGYNTLKIAFRDFIANLPDKEDDYYQVLANFVSNLYQKQCTANERYFLDKTPRYYNIIPEIAKVFPDAKFIFLFRNPVQIIGSMLQVWLDNNFKRMYHYERELNEGLRLLSKGYQILKHKSYTVNYENFVQNPKKYTAQICNYLDLKFSDDMLTDFVKQDTKGYLGDRFGINEYNNISRHSLDKWQQTFATKFRKQYLIKYISSIDDNVLTILGYDKTQIIKQINGLSSSSKLAFKDRYDLMNSELLKFSRKVINRILHGNTTTIHIKDKFLF